MRGGILPTPPCQKKACRDLKDLSHCWEPSSDCRRPEWRRNVQFQVKLSNKQPTMCKSQTWRHRSPYELIWICLVSQMGEAKFSSKSKKAGDVKSRGVWVDLRKQRQVLFLVLEKLVEGKSISQTSELSPKIENMTFPSPPYCNAQRNHGF